MHSCSQERTIPWFNSLSLHDALPICFVIEAARIGHSGGTTQTQFEAPVFAGIDRFSSEPVHPGQRQGQALQTTHLLDLRSEEHTSELQSRPQLVCRRLLENKTEPILL